MVVLTSYLIKKVLEKAGTGRVVIWANKLSEYGIEFRSRTTIKWQALADFLAKFTYPANQDDDAPSSLHGAMPAPLDGRTMPRLPH